MSWQPGQSGNPGGAKKQRVITQQLVSALNEAADGEDRTKLRKLVDKLIERACEGDVPAIREVLDRVDGKVPQGVIGGDEDDPPIRITRIELVPLDDGSSGSTPA